MPWVVKVGPGYLPWDPGKTWGADGTRPMIEGRWTDGNGRDEQRTLRFNFQVVVDGVTVRYPTPSRKE